MPRGGWPRVVDFSTHWSGPLASRELVHLGADVIKVERPGSGDGNRGLGTPIAGSTDVHHALNAGTRSIAVDPRSEEWLPIVDSCARWADVVIVGNRPADARRRGLSFERLVTCKPDLVYCAITGYGLAGPWADRTAHGLQPDLMAGLVPVTRSDGEPRVRDEYTSHGTPLAGTWAALGIMAALHKRNEAGLAQFVTVSLWEAALAWMWREVQSQLNFGTPWPSYGEWGPRYGLYVCADDRLLMVCPIERRFWEAFVDLVGLPPPWKAKGSWDAGADFGAAFPEERQVIQDRLATRSAEAWEVALAAVDVPVSVVRTVEEAARSEHAAASGATTVLRIGADAVYVPLPPVSVTGLPGLDTVEPPEVDRILAEAHRLRAEALEPPPDLDEHRSEILEDLARVVGQS